MLNDMSATPPPTTAQVQAPATAPRHGLGTVRPYLQGPMPLVAFVMQVFGGQVLERHDFGPDSAHVELRIGDSVLVIEAGPLPAGVAPWQNAVYVYVDDVDAAYARALAGGAQSIAPPTDKPYAERQAGFTDAAGNTWWVATCLPR